MNNARKILDAITNNPGIKAKEIAGMIGISRKQVNSVLYGELKKSAFRNGNFQWFNRTVDNGFGKSQEIALAEQPVLSDHITNLLKDKTNRSFQIQLPFNEITGEKTSEISVSLLRHLKPSGVIAEADNQGPQLEIVEDDE